MQIYLDAFTSADLGFYLAL